MKLFLNLFLAIFLMAHVANSKEKMPIVAASINPIYHIVLAITQDKAGSRLIINPNHSQHHHRFKKSDITSIIEADLIFYVSDSLEHKFFTLVNNYNKKDKTFELAHLKGIKLLKKRSNSNTIDPHLWLDPHNAIVIAQFIAKKLAEINPDNAQKYQTNLSTFIKEVETTTQQIQTQLGTIKGEFLFYHDGYQYFENYFNINPLKIISHNHDSELTIKDIKHINHLVQEKQIKCIFGTPQDERNAAMKLAKNHQLNFASLDLIGLKEAGYSALLLNMANSITSCLD